MDANEKKKKAYHETAGKVFCRIVKRERARELLQNLQMRKRLLMYQLNTAANVNKIWEVCLR